MDRELPNTPGLLGYVLVWLVSAVVMPPLYLVPVSMRADGRTTPDLDGFVSLWVFVSGITLVVAVPFAVVGLVLAHAMCSRVPSQPTHVVVTGVVAFVEVFWFVAASGGGVASGAFEAPLVLSGSAAAGAAAGRAVVIPLVLARRSEASSRPDAAAGSTGI